METKTQTEFISQFHFYIRPFSVLIWILNNFMFKLSVKKCPSRTDNIPSSDFFSCHLIVLGSNYAGRDHFLLVWKKNQEEHARSLMGDLQSHVRQKVHHKSLKVNIITFLSTWTEGKYPFSQLLHLLLRLPWLKVARIAVGQPWAAPRLYWTLC